MTTTTEKETERPPTLAEVKQAEAKAEELATKRDELQARAGELDGEIAEALAGGEDPAKLRAEREEVRALLRDFENALPLIRERNVALREAACRGEAERRLVGITRAHGSLRSELEADVGRLRKAAREYRDRVEKMNERYAKLVGLEGEVNALCDRFELERPELERVMPPAHREAAQEAWGSARAAVLADHGRVKPQTEQHPDFDSVRRRTYQELAEDAPGAKVIAEAGGPRPWQLSREALERLRQRKEREAEQARRNKEFLEGLPEYHDKRTEVPAKALPGR